MRSWSEGARAFKWIALTRPRLAHPTDMAMGSSHLDPMYFVVKCLESLFFAGVSHGWFRPIPYGSGIVYSCACAVLVHHAFLMPHFVLGYQTAV